MMIRTPLHVLVQNPLFQNRNGISGSGVIDAVVMQAELRDDPTRLGFVKTPLFASKVEYFRNRELLGLRKMLSLLSSSSFKFLRIRERAGSLRKIFGGLRN